MAIKTREEYIESLRKLRPTVYVGGKKIESVVDSPYFQTSINQLGLGYDWANDPQYEDLVTNWSPIVNEKVSFWTHIRSTEEELFQMVQAIKHFSSKYVCTMCMSMGLGALWAVTWDIDKDKGTKYHENLRKFFEILQREDLRFTMGVMDPKGDRTLAPHKQTDPDLFLRVVERRKDGIVVRGAKMHTTSAPCEHFFVASPSEAMGPDSKDYALSFYCPIDVEGLTFITRPAAGPIEPKEYENPISSRIGFVECLSVFDDVFIPWENVFMCGEYEYTMNFIQYFSPYVRMAKGVCTSARTDLIAGVASLMAHYNGVEKANHIKQKLTNMMIDSNIGWSSAVACTKLCTIHPSGIAIPDIMTGNSGLYHGRLKLVEHLGTLLEIGGGAVTTMPIEGDYTHPELGPIVEKYMQGKVGTTGEDRYRVLQLIQDMTASRLTGYLMSSAICAGGTPETNRVEVYRNYDLKKFTENAKMLAKIKDDEDGHWKHSVV